MVFKKGITPMGLRWPNFSIWDTYLKSGYGYFFKTGLSESLTFKGHCTSEYPEFYQYNSENEKSQCVVDIKFLSTGSNVVRFKY